MATMHFNRKKLSENASLAHFWGRHQPFHHGQVEWNGIKRMNTFVLLSNS